MTKAKTLPFSVSNNVTLEPLEIIHYDLWTSLVTSTIGFKYYVVFIDNFSRFTWVNPLKTKFKTFECSVKIKCLAKNLVSKKIKAFQSYGGGEFLSTQFKSFLAFKGITHCISCPYIAKQNGLAKRTHMHIVGIGLALLSQSKLSNTY